jgi:hypothetical protein
VATVKATHKINTAQVNYILKSADGPVARDLLKRGIRVQSRARRNLGGATGSGPRRIDTGLLRSSIHTNLMTSGSQLVMRVGSGQYYALWVHDGTGIYGPRARKIKPRTAKYLVFRWKKMGNKKVFFKSVKGMPPNPYLKNALPAASLKVPG